jgi:hypothetical protein
LFDQSEFLVRFDWYRSKQLSWFLNFQLSRVSPSFPNNSSFLLKVGFSRFFV